MTPIKSAKNLSFILFFLLLFTLPKPAASQRLIMNVTEYGKIIKYYNEYYVVQVNGTLEVINDYNTTFTFFEYPFNIGSLFIFETSNTSYLSQDKIYINSIDPYETKTISYQILGITAENPTSSQTSSVFATALKKSIPKAYSFLISNIKKSEIENQSINSSGIVSVKNRRLVTVTLENPSDLVYNVTSVKVIKTSDNAHNKMDPNDVVQQWSFPSSGTITIEPHHLWEKDIIDYNSTEGEVYWLSTDVNVLLAPLINDNCHIYWFTQENLTKMNNNSANENFTFNNITEQMQHLLFVKKTISKKVVFPNDVIDVKLSIYNFAPITRTVNITDYFPYGFSLLNDSGISSKREIRWADKKINPNNALILNYKLRFFDNDSIGIDYFDSAVVKYENTTSYSNKIMYIRQYIPEHKLFVQKKVEYALDNEIKVTILVQNVGESNVKDIYVKEFLSANDLFSQITEMPEKRALWKIPELKKGATWQVSYITNENKALNLLPEVFGISKNTILKTLIFQNTIKSEWYYIPTKVFEIFAIIFIIFFPVAFVIFNRRRRAKKERELRSLAKEVHHLNEITQPKPYEAIDFLKKETSKPSFFKRIRIMFSRKPNKKDLRHFAHENIDELEKIRKETERKQ